jgi:hypothetical protein
VIVSAAHFLQQLGVIWLEIRDRDRDREQVKFKKGPKKEWKSGTSEICDDELR